MNTWNTWNTDSIALPDAFLNESESLLQSVLAHVGSEHRSTLIDGLAAVLNIDGRESALPLERFVHGHDHRGALARNARYIGIGLVELVRAKSGSQADIHLRSRCEGHVWTPEVAALLTSVPDAADVMQLYNEWLHQLVLLRDVLMPFVNWREVPVQVDQEGLRRFADARAKQLTSVLTRIPSYNSVVEWAAWAVNGSATEGSYGFRASGGVALPDAVFGKTARLLRWSDAAVHPIASGPPVSFVAEHEDYLSVPQTPPSSHAAANIDTDIDIDIELIELPISTGVSRLALRTGGIEVDLGQALRGLRYAHLPDAATVVHSTAETHRSHSLGSILGSSTLTVFESGDHIIDPTPTWWHTLAVLGSVVPDNIVLWSGEPWTAVTATGKSGRPRVVVDLRGPTAIELDRPEENGAAARH